MCVLCKWYPVWFSQIVVSSPRLVRLAAPEFHARRKAATFGCRSRVAQTLHRPPRFSPQISIRLSIHLAGAVALRAFISIYIQTYIHTLNQSERFYGLTLNILK